MYQPHEQASKINHLDDSYDPYKATYSSMPSCCCMPATHQPHTDGRLALSDSDCLLNKNGVPSYPRASSLRNKEEADLICAAALQQ